jgi:hypothetical protein
LHFIQLLNIHSEKGNLLMELSAQRKLDQPAPWFEKLLPIRYPARQWQTRKL